MGCGQAHVLVVFCFLNLFQTVPTGGAVWKIKLKQYNLGAWTIRGDNLLCKKIFSALLGLKPLEMLVRSGATGGFQTILSLKIA
jgi:hypothetical protein